MTKLKGSEELVSEALKEYFLNMGYTKVSYDIGDDPPDIYLNLCSEKIAVEITDIDENRLNVRRTITMGYVGFIKKLDLTFKNNIPKNKSIIIDFFHNYKKVNVINKPFITYLRKVLGTNKITPIIEDNINGVDFRIRFFNQPTKIKQIITGTITVNKKTKKNRTVEELTNSINDIDLETKFLNIIKNCISDKTKKCANIVNTKYLALYDNYFHKFLNFNNENDIEDFIKLNDKIDNFGIFDKIFIIYDNSKVLELTKKGTL